MSAKSLNSARTSIGDRTVPKYSGRISSPRPRREPRGPACVSLARQWTLECDARHCPQLSGQSRMKLPGSVKTPPRRYTLKRLPPAYVISRASPISLSVIRSREGQGDGYPGLVVPCIAAEFGMPSRCDSDHDSPCARKPSFDLCHRDQLGYGGASDPSP